MFALFDYLIISFKRFAFTFIFNIQFGNLLKSNIDFNLILFQALAIFTALLVMIIAIPWCLVAIIIFFFMFLKLYCGFKPGIQELHRIESKTLLVITYLV